MGGQQYLDYALVSTTYSSQGKTADQVLADIDSTLSKEGLYVAVSRAKSDLKLYTADKPLLYKRAGRSAAKENPSDYLTLFEMVNPNAQYEKAAADTREVRGADQSERIGEISLESALKSATRPLYEEIGQLRQEVSSLREQQRALVEEFEQMQRNHTEQLQMLAASLRQSLADDISD
ncbi:hypothetical protein [Leptolyngbya sp. BC1307]|uniref:hypothetical protein n=1 Tax=Leptolyngbya sp. BC1307 TaxID=2029589 RepID=UPI000EFBF99C|nr:hypothetical protein [Leptolyngbya sp. BC1307]